MKAVPINMVECVLVCFYLLHRIFHVNNGSATQAKRAFSTTEEFFEKVRMFIACLITLQDLSLYLWNFIDGSSSFRLVMVREITLTLVCIRGWQLWVWTWSPFYPHFQNKLLTWHYSFTPWLIKSNPIILFCLERCYDVAHPVQSKITFPGGHSIPQSAQYSNIQTFPGSATCSQLWALRHCVHCRGVAGQLHSECWSSIRMSNTLPFSYFVQDGNLSY